MNDRDGIITVVCVIILVCCLIAVAVESKAKAETINSAPIEAGVVKVMQTAEQEIAKAEQTPEKTTAKAEKAERWESLGECRITEYCPSCNDGAGHESASGVYLEEGHAACSWLPMGTVIRVGGMEYEVVDICGTDAIDLFRDTVGCYCNVNKYRKVEVRR